MAKTKQIGVRFDEDILKSTGLTPQRALNLYEGVFVANQENNILDGENADTTKLDELGQFKEPIKLIKKESNDIQKSELLGSEKPKITNKQFKELCPQELKGFDRTSWLIENKSKYSIVD